MKLILPAVAAILVLIPGTIIAYLGLLSDQLRAAPTINLSSYASYDRMYAFERFQTLLGILVFFAIISTCMWFVMRQIGRAEQHRSQQRQPDFNG